MFSMQQEKTSRTPEEHFGNGVAMMRSLAKLSQRDLAEKLTAKGMPVDASAVSRIEKGTRSVRLVEALAIAEALNTDLNWLLGGVKTASQEFQAMRRGANSSLRLLVGPMVETAWAVAEVQEHLRLNPGLLSELTDAEMGPPASVAEYGTWMAQRINRWKVEDADFVDLDSQHEADQVIEVLIALARRHIGLRVQGEDGVDQEEA